MSGVRNIACIAILVALFIFLGVTWSSIPDQIPAHYDLVGNVDRWGSKAELWIMPAIAVAVYAFITVIEHFPNTWNTGVRVTEANRDRVYSLLKSMIETLKLVICAGFAYMTVESALLEPLPVWFTPVFLIAVLGPIAVYLIRLFRYR